MTTTKFIANLNILAGALLALNYAVALSAIAALPPAAIVATHWDLNGAPDLFSNTWLALLFIPLLGTFLWSSLCSASKFDRESADSSTTYPIRVSITMLVLVVQAIAEIGLACHALGIHA